MTDLSAGEQAVTESERLQRVRLTKSGIVRDIEARAGIRKVMEPCDPTHDEKS